MRTPIYTVVAMLLGACQQQDSGAQKHVADLQNEVRNLTEKVGNLQNAVIDTHRSLIEAHPTEVTLHLTSKAFSVIDTKVGRLYVAVRSVQPYLNGQKIIVDIGNPTATTFSNAKLTLTWGPRVGEDFKDFEAFDKQKRTKEIDEPKRFAPASWTPVEVILDDAPADQLGAVWLKLEFKGVLLNKG